MASVPYALQMWTVRDYAANDFPGTLKRVKEAGYDAVELVGTGGLPAQECKNALLEAGLEAIGCHMPFGYVVEQTDKAAEDARTLGLDILCVPWLDPSVYNSREAWEKAGALLNEAGEKLRKSGIQLCYHNHDHEFARYEGVLAFDILMQAARPENLAAELDVYWVTFGGEDAVATIQQYTGRLPLLHCKDMAKDESKAFTEVGHGRFNWPAIFAAGKEAGVRSFIVEQDECPNDSLESAAASAAFMKGQQY